MLYQSEAEALIRLPKIRKSDDRYGFPLPGETLNIPIISQNGQENFLVDINRGRIQLIKCSYQERYQQAIILIRLDTNGPPHRNPDVVNVPLPYLKPHNGQTIECPHLHLYVEGFMERWAIPAPIDNFLDTNDLYETLQDFFRYCYVVKTPKINWRRTLNEF